MVSTFQFEIYHSKCLLIQLQQVFLVKNVLELCMIKISSFWFFIMHMPSGSCANLKPARPHLIKESSWWKLEYIYFGSKDQQLPFLVRLERINDKMQVRSSVPHKLSMTQNVSLSTRVVKIRRRFYSDPTRSIVWPSRWDKYTPFIHVDLNNSPSELWIEAK